MKNNPLIRFLAFGVLGFALLDTCKEDKSKMAKKLEERPTKQISIDTGRGDFLDLFKNLKASIAHEASKSVKGLYYGTFEIKKHPAENFSLKSKIASCKTIVNAHVTGSTEDGFEFFNMNIKINSSDPDPEFPLFFTNAVFMSYEGQMIDVIIPDISKLNRAFVNMPDDVYQKYQNSRGVFKIFVKSVEENANFKPVSLDSTLDAFDPVYLYDRNICSTDVFFQEKISDAGNTNIIQKAKDKILLKTGNANFTFLENLEMMQIIDMQKNNQKIRQIEVDKSMFDKSFVIENRKANDEILTLTIYLS